MKWVVLAVLAVVFATFEPPAPAFGQSAQLASSGIWQTYGNANDGNPNCSISGYSDAGTFLVVAELKIPSAIKLVLVPQKFNLHPGSSIGVLMTFPRGKPQHFVGQSQSGSIDLYLGQGELAPWLHEFTARDSMTVTFDGTDGPPWIFDLKGTTPTVTAMSDCTKTYGFTSLPAPFMPALTPSRAPSTDESIPAVASEPTIPAPTKPAVAPAYSPAQGEPAPASHDDTNAGGIVLLYIIGAGTVALMIYFLPAIIGRSREISSGGALFFVNLLFGWTVIGWLFCMLWAATGATRGQDAFFKNRAAPPQNKTSNPMDDPAFREAYAKERARLDYEAGRRS